MESRLGKRLKNQRCLLWLQNALFQRKIKRNLNIKSLRFERRKLHSVEKILNGPLWSPTYFCKLNAISVYCETRTHKFPPPGQEIHVNHQVAVRSYQLCQNCITFCRTILASSGVRNKLSKSHNCTRFLLKKRRLIIAACVKEFN